MAKNASLTQHPMRTICDAWLAKIKLALEVRKEKFGRYAEETLKFFDGPHDFMWQEGYSQGPGGFLQKQEGVLPTFRVTINNVFKAVALFGPALYHQNPNVLVSPILPADVSPEALGIDPNDPYGMQEYSALAQQEQWDYRRKQACASLKSKYINWAQAEIDIKTHARNAIQESIVTGLGYLETSIYRPPQSQLVLPRASYLSWSDVVIDPDASYWEDVQWIAIRRRRPVNLTERRFGLEKGELKGHLQSFEGQASVRANRDAKENRKGKSFDLIEYWEVYSKNGYGDLLADDPARPYPFDYSVLGDNCWIVVAKDVPYPLNCPTSLVIDGDAEDVFDAVQWPVPYWHDTDGWPLCRLTYYNKPNEVWPISIFKPAIGEMRFVNWCMSFLADKVAASCHTYVAYMKAAGAEIQKQLNGANTPFTVIELKEALGAKRIEEVVSFLQSPSFPADIWKMLAEVTQEIDEKTGVTELLQGLTSRSMRSAAEANIKNERVSVRPDDMAARTEDWLSEVAVRMIQAARWFCSVEDVAPVVGRLGSIVWQNYVMTSDPEQVVRDFDYRVEAGSTRKPNKQTRIDNLTTLAQYTVQEYSALALQGNVAPWNAFFTEMCKAMDMDAEPFLIQPPQGPPPGEQQAQAELDLKQQEMQMKLAAMQSQMAMKQQAHEQDMQQSKEEHEQTMSQKKQESQAKVQAAKKPKKKAAAK